MSLHLGNQLIPKVSLKLVGVAPVLQEKTVEPLITRQNVVADNGYDALSKVTVNPIQVSELTITTNGNYTPVTGTYYSNVSVNVPTQAIYNQSKTITPTESEQIIHADSGYTGLSEVTIGAISSNYVGSSITRRTGPDVTSSHDRVNIPSGYYADNVSYEVVAGELASPTISINSSGLITARTEISEEGYITAGSYSQSTNQLTTLSAQTVTPTTSIQTISSSGKFMIGDVTINPIPSNYIIPSGNKNIVENGTNIDVTSFATVSVAVPVGSTINNQNKTVTPTNAQQSITADTGYTGLGTVTVEAIPTLMPIKIIVNSDHTIGDNQNQSKIININTDERVDKDTFWDVISALDLSGTTQYMVLVQDNETNNQFSCIIDNYSASSGRPYIAFSGIQKDVSIRWEYYNENISVSYYDPIFNQDKIINPTESQQVVTADTGYTGLGTITVNAIPNDYIGSSIAENSFSDLIVNGATITAPAGYYANDASASVAAMTLPTAVSSSRSGTTKATIDRSTSAQYINIPVGYNSTAASYTISATPNGSVTSPGSISGTTATVSAGTNTLTLTKTISVTPNVTTAGYISAGTAGNTEISLTASVPTKAAATITPGTSNQTIAAGTYLTGIQTISGDANLKAENIKSGVSIFGKTGTFSGLDTSDADAVAANILYGKTAYVDGNKVTGTMANNGATGGTISTQGGTYTIPAGYTSGGTVTASLTASTLTNSIINGTAYEEHTGDYAWRTTVEIPAGYHNATTLTKEFSSIFPAPDTPATASQILLGYQVYDKDGKLITGTMANNSYSNTLNDTRTSVTIPAGYHDGTGTVSHTTVNIPDPTISVSAAGVITASGSWTKGFTTDSSYSNTYNLTTLAATTYNVSSSNQTISGGKYITGTQTIRGVTTSNITAANVKAGTIVQVGDSADSDRILSVTGTFTSDANAAAGEILQDKTAYVNGNKITGTLIVQDVYIRSLAPSSSVGNDGDIWIQE